MNLNFTMSGISQSSILCSMRLRKIIPVKWRPYLWLLVLSLTATATLLMTKSPAVSQTQGFEDNRPSFFPKTSPANKIQRQPLKASQLYEGMTKAEVEQVLGKPSDTKIFPNLDVEIEIMNYRLELILTKVSMIDGHLSGITTELKTVTTNNIPRFAQGIQIGMNRQDLLKLMGKPFAERRNDISMYKFEQLVYVKDSEPAVNVILTDDRVEGINTGLETPPRILKVILPAEPVMPTRGPANQRIRIGMSPQQALSIYGQPTFLETTEFKQQKVVDFVYATLNTDASTRFTFIDNVLTRFSFVPQSNFYRHK